MGTCRSRSALRPCAGGVGTAIRAVGCRLLRSVCRSVNRHCLTLVYRVRCTDLMRIRLAAITLAERMMRMCCRVVMTSYVMVHIVVSVVHMFAGTERAVVMVMMEGIAVMPVPVMRPTGMRVPPSRVISPVPGRMPSVPYIAPEPIVYNRPIDIYRFDDVVRAVHVLVTYYLNGNLVVFISLYIDGCNILIYILCEDSLKHDESFVALSCFHNAQVIHLSVSVEVEITEGAIRVVEHGLELLQVLSLRKELSYHLQIESFRDVRTVGRNRDGLVCP